VQMEIREKEIIPYEVKNVKMSLENPCLLVREKGFCYTFSAMTIIPLKGQESTVNS